MKRNVLKMFSFLAVILFIAASISSAQDMKESKSCCNKETKGIDEDSHRTTDMDSSKSEHQNMGMENQLHGEQSILREGEIDLSAIDKNKDGKVFQDVMDWNVISDEAGECPLCGMKLKEVSLEKAKENLLKHNFKVK